LLEEVKAEYDIVIFDTPPVLAVADAQILANIVDGSILVIRSGQTEVEAAIKAKEALEPAQAKLLGTILRSEEHTSELQSRFDLVCRLLLEKKKQKRHRKNELIL